MKTFYLGVHHPTAMERTAVPLFLSRRQLVRRVRLPRPIGPWALDSGGFSELSMFGTWTISQSQYIDEVYRWNDGMTGLQWASPQDWMCERHIVAKTGLSVIEHQRRTIDSVVALRDKAPDLPWVPVLQGWTLSEYVTHALMYQNAGFDLRCEPLVAIGSVCRRQQLKGGREVVEMFAREGLRLHAFGMKTSSLMEVGHLLESSDSMAWSSHARWAAKPMLPTCTHRSCQNCLPWALEWRARLLRKLEEVTV